MALGLILEIFKYIQNILYTSFSTLHSTRHTPRSKKWGRAPVPPGDNLPGGSKYPKDNPFGINKLVLF